MSLATIVKLPTSVTRVLIVPAARFSLVTPTLLARLNGDLAYRTPTTTGTATGMNVRWIEG